MVCEYGDPAVKLHEILSRLGLAQMEISVRTKEPWGGFTVLDLLTTEALVLLGFRIMHQLFYHS